MLQPFLEVAPAATWLRVIAAGSFLLTGFVVLSHALVRKDAYEERWQGLTAWQGLEHTVRLGGAAVLAGFALWGWELGWAAWVTLGLAGAAALMLLLEGMAFAGR